MLRKLRSHFLNNVVAYIALFVALGGTAYAAGTIGSSDIIDESIQSVDIKGKDATSTQAGVNGTITGADVAGQPSKPSVGQPGIDGSLTTYDIKDKSLVGHSDLAPSSVYSTELHNDAVGTSQAKDNSLTGTDINESTLTGVDAASVGGAKVVKFRYERQLDNPPNPEEVLNLGGLVMTAECRSGGDGLDVNARTTKNGASVFLTSTDASRPDDTDITRDIGGGEVQDGSFTTNDVLLVDNEFASEDGIGTLIYEAPGGSAVVVHFSLDQVRGSAVTPGCRMAGVAIGG